jgi:hypothetical protein
VTWLMRVGFVTFVVSLGRWVLIATWEAIIGDYLGGRHFHYGAELILTVQRIAVDRSSRGW